MYSSKFTQIKAAPRNFYLILVAPVEQSETKKTFNVVRYHQTTDPLSSFTAFHYIYKKKNH